MVPSVVSSSRQIDRSGSFSFPRVGSVSLASVDTGFWADTLKPGRKPLNGNFPRYAVKPSNVTSHLQPLAGYSNGEIFRVPQVSLALLKFIAKTVSVSLVIRHERSLYACYA